LLAIQLLSRAVSRPVGRKVVNSFPNVTTACYGISQGREIISSWFRQTTDGEAFPSNEYSSTRKTIPSRQHSLRVPRISGNGRLHRRMQTGSKSRHGRRCSKLGYNPGEYTKHTSQHVISTQRRPWELSTPARTNGCTHADRINAHQYLGGPDTNHAFVPLQAGHGLFSRWQCRLRRSRRGAVGAETPVV